MKHIEIKANGFTFDVAIKEDSGMGQLLLLMPLSDMVAMLEKTAIDLDLNPWNIEEMNKGATQVIYSLA